MADIQTSVTYTGNGTSGPWPIPFEYISKNYVSATQDGDAVGLTWVSANLVSIPTAVGSELVIRRSTDSDAPITTVQDDSALTAVDLNTEFVQLIHLNQEARWEDREGNLALTQVANQDRLDRIAGDDALGFRLDRTMALRPSNTVWEGRGLVLGGLGYPKSATDAATYEAAKDVILAWVNSHNPPDQESTYDFSSLNGALIATVPVIRTSIRVAGFGTATDMGGAAYIRIATPAGGTALAGQYKNTADNSWWEIAEATITVRMFGAVGAVGGAAIVDDRAAIQAAIDCGIRLRRAVTVPFGDYGVSGPIFINGSTWGVTRPESGEQPSVKAFKGDARAYLGARLVALPGTWAAFDAVLIGRNLAAREVSGLHVDAANLVDVAIDLEWRGGGTSTFDPTDPSCQNVFRDLFGENANVLGVRLDKAADCTISTIWYRGGSITSGIGISMQLQGGGIWADNLVISTGALRMSCQNGSITAGMFVGGVMLVGSSYNNITFTACHFYGTPGDPLVTPLTSGYAILSTATGFATRALVCNSCYFNSIPNALAIFGGRFWQGAIFNGCQFNRSGHFYTGDPLLGKQIQPGAGAGTPPVFQYNLCAFTGALPVDVAGQVLVGLYGWRDTDGSTNAGVRMAGNILMGTTGRINKDRLVAGDNGLYGLSQGNASVPSTAFFGMGYNRSAGQAETETYIRSGIWRLTRWDGTAFTTLLHFDPNGGAGLFPGQDNVRSLGTVANRWTTVFAATGTINTSDARLKTTLAPLNTAELAAGLELSRRLGTYKFLAAVDEKGAGARLHVGLTVQLAMDIMADHGLDPTQYGLICHDEWEQKVTSYPPQVDTEGRVVHEAYDETIPAGDVYSFREGELHSLMIGGQAANQITLEARLAALEAAAG